MEISCRDFLKYIAASAAAMGLSGSDILRAERAIAEAANPPVLWLSGSACTGCSVSLLNATNPTIDQVLLNTINLKYHTTLMGAAGDMAIAQARSTAEAGGHILVVEGAIPTASGGRYAYVWEENGQPVTMADAVTSLAANAKHVLAVGTCSAFGGIAAANPVTGCKGVGAFLGRPVVNLPGCAPHPDWVLGTIVQILGGTTPSLDMFRRPTNYYKMMPIHMRCPRRMKPQATQFGQDGLCVIQLGCKGPRANADCETRNWNNKQSWCIGANGLCVGCVQPDFPDFPFHSKNTHMIMMDSGMSAGPPDAIAELVPTGAAPAPIGAVTKAN